MSILTLKSLVLAKVNLEFDVIGKYVEIIQQQINYRITSKKTLNLN
jgi:riboflavin synthase alpha subunit